VIKALSLIVSGTILAVSCTWAPQPNAATKADSPEGTSGSATVATNAVVPEQARTSVSRLYAEACAKCHGANGEGGGGGTRTLLTADLFDQKHDKPFFDAIKNGVPDMGMEAYGQTLSDPEIWGLVVHIREKQAQWLRRETGSPRVVDGVIRAKDHSYRVETVVDTDQGLRTPWAIGWLPEGRMLVTNRPGGLTVIRNGKRVSEVAGLPAVAEIGQGGFMEVAPHPDYARNGWIYLGYTEPASTGRGGQTKIVRGKITWRGDTGTWGSQQTIFQAAPDTYTGAGVHFGTRVVFDGKGNIFFSIGDRGNQNLAQDLTKPNGKIFRVKEDGSIPADNPFVSADWKAKGALPQIWSYGHRNPQGLVIDDEGNLWDTEHGPRGGDELNLSRKGENYGWPLVAFSINYNDSPFSTPWPTADQKITMPAFRWLPSIGACGMDKVSAKAFPKWKGDLLAGGLSGQNVDRIRVKDGKLVEREELIHGMGRVREVRVGPDGAIYVALNQPDKIIRLVEVR